MNGMDMALRWDRVSFSVIGGFWMRRKRILHDITLSLRPGEVVGLIGPNGAGKTTTLKLGAGLLAPESGRVFIAGLPATSPEARRRLGFLTETQYIYPYLRLREWLVMLAGLSGLYGNQRRHRVDEVLESIELTAQHRQLMSRLSKGQLQRAGLAQLMLHDPQILLLDEPMSGLDPYWRYRVQRLLLGWKTEGKTILFSSHILSDVEKLCDTIALVENGRLRWSGAITDLPRAIKGFEAICRSDTAPDFGHPPESLERLPDGGWRITILPDHRPALLASASTGRFHIDSLQPLRAEIEEVLFGFSSHSTENGESKINHLKEKEPCP